MAAVVLDEFNPHGDNIVIIPTGGGGDDKPKFEGLTNDTINQGTAFNPREGVKATDKGGEVEFTVSPEEIDTCEVGNVTLTYTAGETTQERIITVQKVANPTISGLTPLTVEVGEEFDPLDGVSAVDGNGHTIEVSVEDTKTQIVVEWGMDFSDGEEPTSISQPYSTMTPENGLNGESTFSGSITLTNIVLEDIDGNKIEQSRLEYPFANWFPAIDVLTPYDDGTWRISISSIADNFNLQVSASGAPIQIVKVNARMVCMEDE